MPYSSPSFIAGGNVYPSRFVKIEASESNSIVQAGADNFTLGISHESTREAPIPSASAYAAIDGDIIQIYQLGEACEVLTAATIAAGDFLKPDADGKAVVAVPGDQYGAIACSDAASGERVRAIVRDGNVAATGFLSAVQQALTGAGAINVTSSFTAWTSGGAVAGTLANGTRVGQIKEILLTVAGGNGTLTPTSLSGGTTITFSAVGDFVTLQWNGTAWVVIKRLNIATGAITTPVLA